MTARNFRASPSVVSPSFAFGGRALPYVQPNVRTQFNGNRFANQALPYAAYRNWDRRGDHAWNHHRYHWFGNSWAIIDDGYGYPYGYGDNYDSAPYVTSTPDYDTSDSLAADVQQALAAQGYYHDQIDGDLGPMTRDAIAAYQRDHRLPATGTINAPLLGSLGLD